jgi:threonine/homoserine/homoserine lactone efflux protein
VTSAAFIAVAGLLTLGAISPGPAVLMSARTGVTEGLRTGFFLFWATLALSGLAVIFQIAPALLWAFKIAGGLYLVWMAIGMWRHAAEPLPILTDAPPRSAVSAFRLGLVTQLSNPKPAVLLSAVFIGTVPPGTPLWVIVALLTFLFTVETGWNTIVARIFSLDRTRAAYTGMKPMIDRAFGGLLGLLGLKIATT